MFNWRLLGRLKETESALNKAREELDAIRLIQANRAALASIVRDGRLIRFSFLRNGDIFTIETYCTIDADIEQWKKDLFE